VKQVEALEKLNVIRDALEKDGWNGPTLQACIGLLHIELLDEVCARLKAIEKVIGLE